MSLGLRDDGFFVAAVSPMGPAVVLGILPGSSLLEIDGRKTEGAVFSELLDSLR
jgi:S1-C subfamily serine protease